MQYRTLGTTDIKVSVVCQGCWSIVTKDSTWGGNALEDSRAAIRASLDAGVNFFDTAEGYGPHGESEEILGRTLADVRDEVIIATKVSPRNLRPDDLKAACDRSLGRLDTDRIDLYQVHWPNPGVPLAETFGTLADLREAGKIRAIGVSNFGPGYLRELDELGIRIESNQLCYSLLFRAIEFGIQPWCAAHDISILCYSPICQGLLADKFATPDDVPDARARTRLFSSARPEARHGEDGCEELAFEAIEGIREVCRRLDEPMERVAMAWLWGQPAVDVAIVGGRNAEQARDNAAAGDLQLDEATRAELANITDAVKQTLGSNADMWEHDSRMER